MTPFAAALLFLSAADLPESAAVKPTALLAVPNYCEGVVFDHDGAAYISHRDVVTKIKPDGSAAVWSRTGAPNGHKILPNGFHLVCDASRHAVLMIDPNGEILGDAAASCDGAALRGPNDLSLDGVDGGFYFTDPGGSGLKNLIGTVHYVSPGGACSLIDPGLAFPNGIVRTPDGKRLLVAESQKNRVLEYAISAPGKVGERKVFVELPTKGEGQIDNQPDG
ncbi:MAG: SMP-30/gluconolactonase/LRE family protein, partial [Planctomycetia bacterium]